KQHEAEASRREIALDSTLTEQKSLGAQFEKDIAAAHERATIAEASRSEVMAQVARLQADLASKDSGRSELLGQKTALDRDLALSQAEIKTLRSRLERLESERTEAKADASRGEAALRTALDDEKKRAQRFEKDAAALAERATSWETSRAELNARVAQLERDLARDAKAQAEGADRKATLDKQLTIVSAANADLTGRLAGAHAAQRAQEARLKELETSLSSAASERRASDQRMAKADETHRLALEAAEIRLAEARLTAQTTATQSAENWKSRLDSAEQTTLALKTALDARASEAAAYEKAHVASHAHRQALEERISQLKRLAQAEARGDAKARSTNDSMEKTSIKEPRPKPEPEIAEPETAREKAVWELPRPRFAPSDDSDADFGASLSLGRPIDYSAPDDLPSLGASPRDKQDEEKHRSQREVFLDVSQPDFTPEYEHGIKPEEKRGKSAKGWLAGVASRIRRG
ncbi:MAG: hypothetical protein ABIR28_05750, partial [Vicinamibacteria bacterium]